MNRRNVLVGLGTAAAGSGIVFGSGAFTQVEADRELTIDVEDDSAALIELNANSDSTVVDETDGVFEVDSNNLGGDGVNVDATADIGVDSSDDPFDPSNDPDIANEDEAFSIANQSGEEVDIEAELELSGTGTSTDTEVTIAFDADSDGEISFLDEDGGDEENSGIYLTVTVPDDSGEESDSIFITDEGTADDAGMPNGEFANVAIQVDTDADGEDVDVDGTLTFRATLDGAGGDGFVSDTA